jgi:hypothetical protein
MEALLCRWAVERIHGDFLLVFEFMLGTYRLLVQNKPPAKIQTIFRRDTHSRGITTLLGLLPKISRNWQDLQIFAIFLLIFLKAAQHSSWH